MADYYAISGFFREPISGDSAFGGFLALQKDRTLGGLLVDVYGPSHVKGILDLEKGKLDFEKTYVGREDKIKYDLIKDEEGIYHGSYGGSKVVTGPAFCRLSEHFKGIDFRMIDAEEVARDMIDLSVAMGDIEIYKGKDGQDMVRVTDKWSG